MAKSTTPPPPKSSGTGYIAAGIVMLLAMGGLIMWKVGQDKPPPPTPPEPPKPAKTAPILEEPPPPPPPPEPKDAEAEKETKKVKKVAAAGGGACATPCNGTVTGPLGSALRAKGGQARGCYERALRLNNTLKGRVMVAVTIGRQGQVCSANVTQNSLGDAAVASCITQRFRSGTFPPPKGGCVNTQVPLNFIPKQ